MSEMIDRESRKEAIAGRLRQVRSQLPFGVELIVVTKNFPSSDIEILFDLGERNFGENRVQELVAKRSALSDEINQGSTWHFQGQIQSNKIPALNDFADVIHSLDSRKAIEKVAPEKRVFLQVNLDPPTQVRSAEGTGRAGIDQGDLRSFTESMLQRFAENFLGVMAVAPHFPGITREDTLAAFARLKAMSEEVREIAPSARFISAGMSEDFMEAIAHGATHVRLGSSILGSRLAAN